MITPAHPDPVPIPATRTRLAPTHDEIARRAETLWSQAGCPHGRNVELWLEAEHQLCCGPDFAQAERDRVALADPSFAFNRDPDDLMKELNEEFPDATGKETTSL